MKLNHPKFISTLSALIIFILYMYNIISYTEKTDISNQKIISKHADVISDDIWRFDKSSAEKYLNLALEANYYESISVILATNESFLSINITPKERLDKLFIRYNLIQKKEYKAKIIVDNLRIGMLSAIVYIRNIYYYFYAFLVSMLLFLITAFITTLQFSRKILNRTVLDKTAELQESQERLKNILQTNPNPVVVYDTDGFPQFISPSFTEVFGWTLSEIQGKNIPFVPADEEKITHSRIKDIYNNGKPIQFLTKRLTKSNEVLNISISAAVYKDTQGEKKGLVVNLTDITEQIKIQDQLRQAQKMESVGRLAGGVAHDFNNMLGVILGHTELALLKTDEDHDLNFDLKEIQTAAMHSANITKQLLGFARKQTVSPQKLDLNNKMMSMLTMLRRLIGENINLVWQAASNIWSVKMDPSQIDQILANLCINARDAIPGMGEVNIKTGIKTIDEEYCNEHPGFIPGDFVLLAVSDNGCGMDKTTLDNLFEPFYTTKEVGKGTGLGLATVYGIVKQNNGFINVSSELGQGTTFNIYLPRFFADEHPDKTVPKKKAAPEGGTETILLVEDEYSILQMTRMLLEKMGYQVLSASRPSEAVEKAKKHSGPIDLLITDVIMPEKNGHELAEQITALFPEINLLFMSGYTADIITHKGVLDAEVAFIQKPFSLADLSDKVREVLDMNPDKTQQ